VLLKDTHANLILEGVGFKSEVKGTNLELALGFSHPVIVPITRRILQLQQKKITLQLLELTKK
jgi:ribosomal protein L6P/L9E